MAQSSNDSGARRTKANKKVPEKVAFHLSPALADEVKRILQVTDLGTSPEVFRRAFTLLRIHVDASLKDQRIYIADPSESSEKYIITLPFTVRSKTDEVENL